MKVMGNITTTMDHYPRNGWEMPILNPGNSC